MGWLAKTWEWFSGKKVIIGTISLGLSAFLTQVAIAQWGIDASVLPKIIATLDWFGMLFGGVGLFHKVQKR